MRSRRRLLGVTVALAVLVPLVPACLSTAALASTQAAAPTRPNIVFILTDDMSLDQLVLMPSVKALISDRGMTFDRAMVNVTTCCPSRTSILRGQYAHNTGVLANVGTNGGFQKAHSLGLENADIATALKGVGYRTGYFGKYLNGYPDTVTPSYVPPGWDSWTSATAGTPYAEYNYTLNQNGLQVNYGSSPSDYGTDVYFWRAMAFMSGSVARGAPFFAHIAVYAPHHPWIPAPQDLTAFPNVLAPRNSAYDEADVSDKPAYIRSLPRLSTTVATYVDRVARARAQTLLAVDRGVARVVANLERLAQLDNTYIIFTSDNGYHLGAHRLPSGKQTPYQPDINVPLVVVGPGVPAKSRSSALVGNIDLAPTMAALGGASLPYVPDGRSLVPFLTGAPPTSWRSTFLLEHWTSCCEGFPRELEPDPDLAEKKDPTIPQFKALRSARYKYVEYKTGERELYDLQADPLETKNLVSTASSTWLGKLHNRLFSLGGCLAVSCRYAENLDVGP